MTTETGQVAGAVNEPKGVQHPRIPIMVGGNGPEVTWRLAALYADELNITGKTPETEAEAAVIPVIRSRCEEIGRDFDSLLTWARHIPPAGKQGVDVLGRYAAAGLDRAA